MSDASFETLQAATAGGEVLHGNNAISLIQGALDELRGIGKGSAAEEVLHFLNFGVNSQSADLFRTAQPFVDALVTATSHL